MASHDQRPRPPPAPGLPIESITSGDSLDTEGYSITVGGETRSLDVSGSTLFSDLQAGEHDLELTEIQRNCTVEGTNPRVATVVAGDTVTSTFDVTCRPALFDRILFTTNRDGRYEIYSMATDGSDVTPLTDEPGFDGYPTWSPDGMFHSFRDGNVTVYRMNADGSSQQRLTEDPATDQAARWSPDGSRIAFDTNRDGCFEIYLMDADGSDQINLTTSLDQDRSVAWTPAR